MMRTGFFRVLALALGAALLGDAAPPPAADGAVGTIARAYFADVFRAQPIAATQIGVHDYDTELGRYTAAAWEAQLANDRRYRAKLEAIDPSTLGVRAALDRRNLLDALDDDLLINGTMAQWKHQPDTYVQLASNAVFTLIERPFAPESVRLRAVIARENAIPALFAAAKANLTTVDADTAKIALDDVSGSSDFFETTVPSAFPTVTDPALRAALRASTRRAAAAANDFATWLKHGPVAHPHGTFAIGAANYAARLKYEEGLDVPLAEYLRVGTRALADTRARMIATAKLIVPNGTVPQALAVVARKHPTSATLLAVSQSDLVKLRAFIVAHDLITLPADADVKVTETPAFLRQTTVASMDAPGPLEKHATRAYYNVTPVDPHDSPKVQEQYLEAFNDFERPIISAHEVYPGHFVNFVVDKHLPLTLTEKLTSSTSFVEGWAHYCEQMMVDEGWGDGDPRTRIAQLKEAILRNARFVVGVKLHTQGMTVPQAIAFFETEAFLDPAEARIEARRGTQDATYGYYTLGKLEILKLRADYRKKLGKAFTLRKFHDALLSYGNGPVPFLRPILLGADDDGHVLP
jgi:uncharacterized protein (DUF885 family)